MLRSAQLYYIKHNIQTFSGVSRISFRGGVQNFPGKVGEFAWREAPCSAWLSHAFARGVRGHAPPRKFKKNGAIWCVLESILLKFYQNFFFLNSHFLYKNNR